jgi:hypothetical protein
MEVSALTREVCETAANIFGILQVNDGATAQELRSLCLAYGLDQKLYLEAFTLLLGIDSIAQEGENLHLYEDERDWPREEILRWCIFYSPESRAKLAREAEEYKIRNRQRE